MIGLDLVGGEVLRFVDDKENLDQAAPADIGQRGDDQLLLLQKFADAAVFGLEGGVLVLDHPEIVVERLHIGVELGLDITGQEADIAVGKRHYGPGPNSSSTAMGTTTSFSSK